MIDKVFRGCLDLVVDFITRHQSGFLLRDILIPRPPRREGRPCPRQGFHRRALPIPRGRSWAPSRALAKTIDLRNIVDPEVLGGVLVRFDGMVADGSLRTDLNKIRARMLEPRFGSELIQ